MNPDPAPAHASTTAASQKAPAKVLKLHVVTAGLIFDGQGRLLICRRAPARYLPGYWEFPGGKLEPQESPEACLARELMEELGLRVKVGSLVTAVHHTYDRYRVLLLAYLCQPEPAEGSQALEALQPLTAEHDAVAWVAPEAIEGGGGGEHGGGGDSGGDGQRGGGGDSDGGGEYELLEADKPLLHRVLGRECC